MSAQTRGTLALAAITPGRVVAALLVLCAIKGLWLTTGVVVPPDPDTVRDLGFIQAVRDGNWFGDPATEGAWRWYPPLLHNLAALLTAALPLTLYDAWLHAGVLLNLLTPASFYWMNCRLVGRWPAAAATVLLVLAFGAALPGDASAGYTPWTLTPALAWPPFFVSVRLIAGAAERLRPAGTVVAGSAVGLLFLAHTVPSVLLAGLLIAAVVTLHGVTRRSALWLVAAGGIALLWTTPFLLPLLLAYRLHIVHPDPGAWVHPVLSDRLTLLPTALGLFLLAWLVRQRAWAHLPRSTVGILGAWIALCGMFLVRHYACSDNRDGVCGVFVVAAHHYLVYLQAAWATVAGLALALLWRRGEPAHWVRSAAAVLVVALIAFFADAEDLAYRRLGQGPAERVLDRAAYEWILARTEPGALFVTELPPNPADMGPGAAAVIAAGRRLVAPPGLHSNPYLPWTSRNEQRLALLKPGADLCPLLREAGEDGAFFLLPHGRTVAAAPVFDTAVHTIYRVPERSCRRPP